MKSKKGKQSEAFWPSIVMKKWLNIKPKVSDFSEDEVDTETESDDEGCVKDRRTRLDPDQCRLIHENEEDCQTQLSDTASKAYKLRRRRGKSETLRAQYINSKDVRVTIGTWNVAGRAPNHDLEIDDWLCMEDPADIYILGFQEVVPLNAGNVLGAEDKEPIPKWEAIIRRSLNKSSQPESKHKSYSAPPSPIVRKDSTVDAIAPPLIKTLQVPGIGKNLQLKRLYGIDCETKLDWPENSFDESPRAIMKLRKVLSSTARMGFHLAEGPQNFTYNGSNLKRSHSSLGLIWKEQQMINEVFEEFSDVSDQSSEEETNIFSELPTLAHENKDIRKSCKEYVRIISKQMVGIYVSIWVRKRLRRHINNLKVSPVGVGLMGYMGNKGSVSISMSLFQSRLCFVCSHLASGQKDGAEQRRNADVYEIIRRTRFASVFDEDQPQTISSHDQIFWFGDLNYRLNMTNKEVRKLVSLKRWNDLINSDQLSRELRCGRVFEGWKEGLINFPPTYKYEINSDRYVGENPREGEKKRSPAWCDRILWLGKSIKQFSYKRSDIRLSDHRPVSSVFAVEVEVFNHRKLQKALTVNTAAVHPRSIFFGEDEDKDEDEDL